MYLQKGEIACVDETYLKTMEESYKDSLKVYLFPMFFFHICPLLVGYGHLKRVIAMLAPTFLLFDH